MGYFTLFHEGISTIPVAVDAPAREVKMALESLSSIGSVSVTKDLIGVRRNSNGQNLVPGATSLSSVWSVTLVLKAKVDVIRDLGISVLPILAMCRL